MSNTEFRDDYSWSTYDDAFLRLVEIIQPERVLDIGAGSGKYGKLVRKMKKDAHITGIEIDQDVIKNEKLDLLHVHYAIPHASSAYLANQLFQHIEENIPLEKEIDIVRCYKKK